MSTAGLLAWGVWAVVLADRLAETVVARRNRRWAAARGGVEHDRAFTRVVIAFHTAWFAAFALELALRPGRLVVPVWLAAAALLVLQGGRAWVIATLGRRWSTGVVTLPGAPPVRHGPYRFLRHPNYLVVAVELYLYPAMAGCWLTALIGGSLDLAVLARRISAEERALARSA